MSPYDWKIDAARARHEAEQPPRCAACDDPAHMHSTDLGTPLCLSCWDAFQEWDRRNPTEPYDAFLPTAVLGEREPVLVGAEAGRALVGALLLTAALALVIAGLVVALSTPILSGGHLIAGPVLILAGAAIVGRLIVAAEVAR